MLEEKLITAHGILMLVAWPILSFTAIFFAVWMKPALPNGQWLQVIDTSPSSIRRRCDFPSHVYTEQSYNYSLIGQ